MLKTFDHYCEYRKTPNGLVLSPMQLNKWLVLFCDEINLPDMDRFGTTALNFVCLGTDLLVFRHTLLALYGLQDCVKTFSGKVVV